VYDTAPVFRSLCRRPNKGGTPANLDHDLALTRARRELWREEGTMHLPGTESDLVSRLRLRRERARRCSWSRRTAWIYTRSPCESIVRESASPRFRLPNVLTTQLRRQGPRAEVARRVGCRD